MTHICAQLSSVKSERVLPLLVRALIFNEPSRKSVQANTEVTSISYRQRCHKAIISTPRVKKFKDVRSKLLWGKLAGMVDVCVCVCGGGGGGGRNSERCLKWNGGGSLTDLN